MKRILFSLALLAGSFFTPRAHAQDEVTLDVFYDNLSSQGSWIEVGDYGYCFQPAVAAENPNWRPYTDGYWAYTDYGWTWVSYEDFGWATYHYGRWTELENYGWVWVPGYEWGPAWVSWRTGGDYVGWAPLPPGPGGVSEARAIDAQADVEFEIGPAYYNFVDIRYIGAPVLRNRILAPAQNVTIINTTVNVTNITYKNATVYNYGPDFDRVNRFSTTPIQRLKIHRENATTLAGPFGHNLNRVKGNQLMVVAPRIQKAASVAPPKNVKAKIARPTLEHGWKGVANREQIEAEMKKQSPKSILPNERQIPSRQRVRQQPSGAEKSNTRKSEDAEPTEQGTVARPSQTPRPAGAQQHHPSPPPP
jgi:hypothetical protein